MKDMKNDITDFLAKLITGILVGAAIGAVIFIGILLLAGACV